MRAFASWGGGLGKTSAWSHVSVVTRLLTDVFFKLAKASSSTSR